MFPVGVGSTGVIVYVVLRDKTTGDEMTGLAYNSAGAKASYTRPKQAAVEITLASQTPTGDWVSGGFCEISSTLARGLYRLDLPDGAAALGADYALPAIFFSGVRAEVVLVLLDIMPDVIQGLVVSDATNNATTFKTDLPSSTTDAYKSGWLVFRTGALAGQVRQISGYDGPNKRITLVEAFTGTPADNSQIVFLNR